MMRANPAVRGESEVRAVSMGEDGVVELREGTSESVLRCFFKEANEELLRISTRISFHIETSTAYENGNCGYSE